MKANANQIHAAVDAANPDVRLYLLYGPDDAGAQDLIARLARALGPDAERVDLDGSQLKARPSRLADEAASLSLFGGRRYIRVTGAGDDCVEPFAALLAADHGVNPVIAVGAGLKATAPIVKLVIGHPRAMGFACYLPTGADAEKLATSIARTLGIRVTGDTAARLATASGGDRAVMTRELEKVALYIDAAPDRPRALTDAALDEIGADVGDAEISRLTDAAIGGQPAALGVEFARLSEAGISPIIILRAVANRLILIAELGARVAAGEREAAVLERIFWRDRATTARALRAWSPAGVARAVERIRQAERAVMASSNAGGVLADAAILGVARTAARRH